MTNLISVLDRIERLFGTAPKTEQSAAKPTEQNEAYRKREVRDARLIARLGAWLTPADKLERRKNYEKMMADPKFLRDIDDIDTVSVVTCSACDKPMVVVLDGNGKHASIWLECCDGMSGSRAMVTVPARSFTGF